jgi:hypothetical protein
MKVSLTIDDPDGGRREKCLLAVLRITHPDLQIIKIRPIEPMIQIQNVANQIRRRGLLMEGIFRLSKNLIRAEQISYGEIVELQSLSKYIDKNDVELDKMVLHTLSNLGLLETKDLISLL